MCRLCHFVWFDPNEALQFPHIRLGFLFRFWLYFRWFRLPAWFAVVLWLSFQFIGAAQQLAGISTVSSLAHLGGAVVGLVAWLLWRKPNVESAALDA